MPILTEVNFHDVHGLRWIRIVAEPGECGDLEVCLLLASENCEAAGQTNGSVVHVRFTGVLRFVISMYGIMTAAETLEGLDRVIDSELKAQLRAGGQIGLEGYEHHVATFSGGSKIDVLAQACSIAVPVASLRGLC